MEIKLSALNMINTAQLMSLVEFDDINRKWLALSIRFTAVGGVTAMTALQRVGALDCLLRQLEREMSVELDKPADHQLLMGPQILFDHSEVWLLRAYEVIRAAAEQMQDRKAQHAGLSAVKRRLALVRMPIAKAEIARPEIKARATGDPLMLRRVGGEPTEPEPYVKDGSYIMPTELCRESGSAIWHPVDLDVRQTVAIARRDLAEEILALEFH